MEAVSKLILAMKSLEYYEFYLRDIDLVLTMQSDANICFSYNNIGSKQ